MVVDELEAERVEELPEQWFGGLTQRIGVDVSKRVEQVRGINWYNAERLHTSLEGIPPIEWEQQYRQAS